MTLRACNLRTARSFFVEKVEIFCPSGLFELTRRPSGQKISTLPKDICSSERKKLNGLSLRTTSFCFRIKEMEKVFCHPSVSPSLYNLLANKNPCFYFPAPLHYFPPLRLYFQLNPYSKYQNLVELIECLKSVGNRSCWKIRFSLF